MAKWDSSASLAFREVQQLSGASDMEMQNLKSQIEQWANSHDSDRTFIAFGRMRDNGVSVKTNNGWITDLTYGDRD